MKLAKPGTRSLKKFIIFPCCLLIFGALEEVVDYKSAFIRNDYLRVGALMAFYAFGIALLAFVFTPMLERVVLRLHAASRIGAGRLGEYLFVAALLVATYYLWFKIVVLGPQSILPPSWR